MTAITIIIIIVTRIVIIITLIIVIMILINCFFGYKILRIKAPGYIA